MKAKREGTHTIEDESPSKGPSRLLEESTPNASSVQVNEAWKKVGVEYAEFNGYMAGSLEKSVFGDSFVKTVDMVKYEEITVFQRLGSGEEIIVAIDKTASSRKIVILAIRSSLATLEDTLRSLCEYFWQHDSCVEVRVGLLHHKMGEITTVDKELSARLKGVGFRWAMVNHSQENTQTIFSIKRPLDTVAHKTERRKQAYPVVIEHLCTFVPDHQRQGSAHSNCLASSFALLDIIKEKNLEVFEKLAESKRVQERIELMKSIEEYQREEAAKNEVK